jgi:putative FmdB family regulatory protein
MPVYEYRCLAKGHIFDLRRGIDERDKVALCPECQAESSRLISPFASKSGIYIRPSAAPDDRGGWGTNAN